MCEGPYTSTRSLSDVLVSSMWSTRRIAHRDIPDLYLTCLINDIRQRRLFSHVPLFPGPGGGGHDNVFSGYPSAFNLEVVLTISHLSSPHAIDGSWPTGRSYIAK